MSVIIISKSVVHPERVFSKLLRALLNFYSFNFLVYKLFGLCGGRKKCSHARTVSE